MTSMESNLRARIAELERLVYADDLTGLRNRRWLTENISDKAGYIYLDLDNFKKVNDELGHDVGDEILREFAVFLLKSSRSGGDGRKPDTVRHGGDEFLVVCNSPEAAAGLLSRLTGWCVIRHGIGVTVSGGSGHDIGTAEKNMRKAKVRKGASR